jgi:hypothetical protein
MKYLIKIDPNSIKKNPDAGRTDYSQYIGSTSTLTINKFLDPDFITLFEEKFNARLTSKSWGTTPKGEQSVFVLANCDPFVVVNYLQTKNIKIEDITINSQAHYNHFHTMTPEPKYFYNHEDTEVECSDCKAKFKHTELIDDLDWDYDGEDDYQTGSSRTCPKCGEPDCCELEFEKFDPTTTQVYSLKD